VRIGYDISQTGFGKAGCGVVAAEFLRAFDRICPPHEFILYPVVGDFFLDPDWRLSAVRPSRLRWRLGPAPSSLDRARRFWSHHPESLESRLGHPELLHLHSFFAPTRLPKTRLVWTLHDLDFLVHPDWSEEANRFGCFQGALNASLGADLVVSVSEFSRRQFLDIFPHYPEDRTVTVPLASRFDPASSPSSRPSGLAALPNPDFFLTVATLQPRKNLPRLLQAWSRLRQQLPNCPNLVLAGGEGWLSSGLHDILHSLPGRDGVFTTGYVTDSALAWLYRNCFAFVLPSLAEGFGLPALEAMSLGAPTVVSRVTSLPEVVGDAALFIDPESVDSLAAALQSLCLQPELRVRLRDAGLRHASSFSWDLSARRLLDLYHHTLTRPKYSPSPEGATHSVPAQI